MHILDYLVHIYYRINVYVIHGLLGKGEDEYNSNVTIKLY